MFGIGTMQLFQLQPVLVKLDAFYLIVDEKFFWVANQQLGIPDSNVPMVY